MPGSEDFIICVQEPDSRHTGHIIIHPVLLVCNRDANEYTSPEIVIRGFELIGCRQKSKMISISKTQVSDKNWELLKAGLGDSEIYNAGLEIQTKVLYS